MSDIENLMKHKTECFSIRIPPHADPNIWFENELINNPYALSTIKNFSYRVYVNEKLSKVVSINISYLDDEAQKYIFLVKDVFELITVISLSLKLHLCKTTIIIDNRTSFIPENGLSNLIKSCQEYVGEELQIHQFSSSCSTWRSFFKNRIIIYTMKMQYFDTDKDINDLSCLLSEQAKVIRNTCSNQPVAMIDSIMKWFRQNIKYKKTNSLEDHSAVGLYKNRTAVCQGIAAYAYLLLTFCGIKARYVSGEGKGLGGWGPHGWNMVQLNGKWHHIDYTFELNSMLSTPLKPIYKFKKDHRWDEDRYCDKKSNDIAHIRSALDHSLIILLPNKFCFSVNGCIVDTTGSHLVCYTDKRDIFVDVIDIVKFSGGFFVLKDNDVFIYIGTNTYIIPFNQIIYKNKTWYTSILWLEKLNFKIKIENQTIRIEV